MIQVANIHFSILFSTKSLEPLEEIGEFERECKSDK